MTVATTSLDRDYLRNVSPPANDHRSFQWDGGRFDMARRSYTEFVEGAIRSPHNLVMATLRGGAARHEMKADCGHQYDGPDYPGAVSFLPAGCGRRLALKGVAWEWASIALPPSLFNGGDDEGQSGGWNRALRPFSNMADPFLFGLLSEFERLYVLDGRLDATYCDAMSFALVQYLRRRLDGSAPGDKVATGKLPPWRLRRIADYVDAHLHQEIRIASLASLVGLSEGHLHRAFRATTDQTPLQFVNQRRIQRAIEILASEPTTIADLALRLGFVSPSHFTRVFRSVTGTNPSQFRREL